MVSYNYYWRELALNKYVSRRHKKQTFLTEAIFEIEMCFIEITNL